MIFQCSITYKEIKRGEDIDYFIGTENRITELYLADSHLSRLQFPQSRALLIRTSPQSKHVTVHILKDTDLYSSIVNFVVDLNEYTLRIEDKQSIQVIIDPIKKSTLQ